MKLRIIIAAALIVATVVVMGIAHRVGPGPGEMWEPPPPEITLALEIQRLRAEVQNLRSQVERTNVQTVRAEE